MAKISTIIEIEEDNKNQIHLFREGLFLKAYQRSAFQFQQTIKDFRAIKKHYKAIGANVVMIGFPSQMLAEIIPTWDEVANGHIKIDAKQIDETKYQHWFAEIQYKTTKPKRQTQPSVITKITDFVIENATPIQCMEFISELKTAIRNGSIR